MNNEKLTLAQLKSIGTVGGATSGLGTMVPSDTSLLYTSL